MVLVQKIRFRTILSGLLVATIFMNGCATASKNATSEKKSKTQLLENIRNDIPTKTISSTEIIRLKLDQFKKALNKKNFTEQDWKLHDELLEYYAELKNRKAAKVNIPAKTRIAIPLETYCLNPDRAVPNAKEVYSWQKSNPGIKYFSELLDLRRNGKIEQEELQGLIWNLKNETRWEEYPNRQKSILQKIDPNASINLPSSLKDKGIDFVMDQVSSVPGLGEVFDTYELVKGKYYELSDIKKSIEGLTSKYDLEEYDNLIEIPGTGIYSQSESQGYNSQEITFYNPTDRDQELDLTQYYLEPERDDVQRIGINPKIPEDPYLLSDLEKLLYESMLRIGVGFTPGINDVADLYELFTGKDFLTGNNLSTFERSLSGVGVIAGSGQGYRYANRVLNAPSKYLPEFEKGIEKVGGRATGKLETLAVEGSFKSSRSRIVNKFSAEEVNARHIEIGNAPPYKKGTQVSEIHSQVREKWVRVHGDENVRGKWIIREESLSGLNPEQIKAKFSLPKTPTHISDVSPPPGTRILRGRVAENFGGKSGAVQYEINLPKEHIQADWFSNKRVLK